jgi:hypothetical protein
MDAGNAGAAGQRFTENYIIEDTKWLEKMEPEERVRKRPGTLQRMVGIWGKSRYPAERWIADQYQVLYKPGGPNNPILVGGDSPLTQSFVEVETAFLEILLEQNLTTNQREEFQQFLVDAWKGMSTEQRANAIKGNNTFVKLPNYSDYSRHLTRALNLPRVLNSWGKYPDFPRYRWCKALYEGSARPGSRRNPVLVDDTPPLTQIVMDRYGDYLEVMLDLSTSGGLTAQQRQVLQDYLVKDWKKMTADQRDELLADLKRWADAAGTSIEEAKKCIGALRPKLLAQLSTARDDGRSQWLLEIAQQERKKADQLAESQRMQFEAMRFIIRAVSEFV